jgi:superoxide dismutase
MNAVKGTALEGNLSAKFLVPISKQTDAVRNNGGGYYNHLFFWKNLGKGSSKDHQMTYLQLLQSHLVRLINSKKHSTLQLKHGLEVAGPGYI